jgi:hypothetical protein
LSGPPELHDSANMISSNGGMTRAMLFDIISLELSPWPAFGVPRWMLKLPYSSYLLRFPQYQIRFFLNFPFLHHYSKPRLLLCRNSR